MNVLQFQSNKKFSFTFKKERSLVTQPYIICLKKKLAFILIISSRHSWAIFFRNWFARSCLAHSRVLFGQQIEQMAGLRGVQTHKRLSLFVLDFEAKAVFSSGSKRENFLPRERFELSALFVGRKKNDSLRTQNCNGANFGCRTNQLKMKKKKKQI